MQFVRIPKDRIGALVGKGGETKRYIEEQLGVVIDIDSETGEVNIDTANIKDPVNQLKVIDIVKAIGRGFSPERAFRLFDDDVFFELIDIRDYVGKSPKHIRRVKARVIGSSGKTRALISELSGADITIYGNTIGIIGDYIELDTARTAIDMLLSGSEHSAVYRYLENKRRESKLSELSAYESGSLE
jgi:ribosomal RNA assembly protein